MKKTIFQVCFCGHLEDKHELMLETYFMCVECHGLGLLRNKFIHDFKFDNLRYLEMAAEGN